MPYISLLASKVCLSPSPQVAPFIIMIYLSLLACFQLNLVIRLTKYIEQTKMQRLESKSRVIQTKSTAEILPSLKGVIDCLKSQVHLQNQIIEKINHIFHNKKTFQQQGKILREQYQSVFKLYDKEIEHNLLKISRKMNKQQGKRSKSGSEHHENKKRNNTNENIQSHNLSCLQQNLDSKSTEKRNFQKRTSNQLNKSIEVSIKEQTQTSQPNKKQIQSEKVKISSSQSKCNIEVHQNLTLLSKQNRKTIQVYCCLICYKSNEEPCMWQRQNLYLAHLKDKHQIFPNFQNLLLVSQEQVIFSHAFFKGKLINLFKNSISQHLIHMVYLLHKKRYEQLYFCGCKNQKAKKQFSIHATEQQFYRHLKIHKKDKLQKIKHFSHLAITKDKFITFIRNKQFDFQKVEELFNPVLSHITKTFSETISKFTFQGLVTFNHLNNMELISCNKKIREQLGPEQIYDPLPYCSSCNIYLESWTSIMTHLRFNKCLISGNWDKTLGIIREYMSKTVSYKQIHITGLSDKSITMEEEQILKAQFILMKSEKSNNKMYMICGECHLIFRGKFSNRIRKYLSHIYLEHSKLHSLNNYEFKFLLESTQLQQDTKNDD